MPRQSRDTIVAIVSFILSQVEYILAWLNRFVGGVIRKRFGLDPKFVEKTNQYVHDGKQPKTADEFLANIKAKFQGEESVNGRFFKKNPKFFEELASKAMSLADDEDEPIAGDNLFKTVQITLHQQVLYCDDSTSMKREKTAANSGGRWDSQTTLINRIARITTRILPEGEGTYLRYINQDVDNSDSLSLEDLREVLQKMKPIGLFTPVGTNLKSKILEPLVYNKLPNSLTRPLLISVITDGVPSGEEVSTFVENIIECGERLEECGLPRSTVKFLVGQVGSNKKAEAFVQSIRKEKEIEDIVYVVSGKLDDPDLLDDDMKMDAWLIETLYGPIMQAEAFESEGK